MAKDNKQSVIAIFANRCDAEAAIDELWHAGFQKKDIGLASPGESLHEATTPTGRMEDMAAHGAAVGAVTGGTLGAFAGAIAVGTIPAFGPVLAGGLLLGMLGGAAAGAALGTFAGPFVAMGLSTAEIQRYQEEFRSGRTIVVAESDDLREEAIAILTSHGALSVEIPGGAPSLSKF